MLARSLVTGLIALLVLALAPVAQASGRTFFVSTSGSNSGAGTEAAPWRTLDHGLRQLHPGDTLVVRGGTYAERVRNPSTRAGTPTARITVRAAAGERPVVRGLFWVRGTSHWTFDGINVTWDDATGQPNEHMVKLTDGVGWTFKNAEVWGARSYAGMLIASSVAGEPADWRVANNCIHDTYPANNTNQDQLIYANPDIVGRGGVIERNLLFNAPNGNGIKLGGPDATRGGAAGVTVRHNTIYNTTQNIMVAWRSRENTIESNILGGTTSNYGAIRSYGLDNSTNRASGNIAFETTGALFHYRSPDGEVIDAGGNLFPLDPLFDATSACGQFRPLNPLAAAAGHLAGAVTPQPPSSGPSSPAPQPPPSPPGDVEEEPPTVPSVDDDVVDEEPSSDQTGGKKAKPVRVKGAGRVATSVATADFGWESAENLVLARADDPADALAGAPLAGKLQAPLVVNPRTSLAPEVVALVQRLGVSRVFLLGGPGALGDQVAADLQELGMAVERVAGATRVETAVAIADLLDPGRSATALLVRGAFPGDDQRSWPDALAASGLAARQAAEGDSWPVLVVPGSVPRVTSDALDRHGIRNVFVVGGAATVPASVDQLLAAAGRRVDRLSGVSRYATSRAIADLDLQADPAPLLIATGDGFADGLAAGALAGRLGGTLLLVPSSRLDQDHQTWLRERRDRYSQIIVIGGEAAVSGLAMDQVGSALAD